MGLENRTAHSASEEVDDANATENATRPGCKSRHHILWARSLGKHCGTVDAREKWALEWVLRLFVGSRLRKCTADRHKDGHAELARLCRQRTAHIARGRRWERHNDRSESEVGRKSERCEHCLDRAPDECWIGEVAWWNEEIDSGTAKLKSCECRPEVSTRGVRLVARPHRRIGR
jgi:hypothetical protein